MKEGHLNELAREDGRSGIEYAKVSVRVNVMVSLCCTGEGQLPCSRKKLNAVD